MVSFIFEQHRHKSDNENVSIGTGIPCYPLDVRGIIRSTEEVIVESTIWCDYVFDNNYVLEPFAQRIKTIKSQKHLPNVLPEKEILKNGIPVSKTMQSILKNVEELYLYMDQLHNKMTQLEQENKELKQLLNTIK